MLNTWIINWQAHQLLRAPLALFNAPIFHPLPDTLALSEIIWPAAPAAAPLLAATANPVLVYNLTFLGSFFVAAVGMYALALYVTRNRLAALLAGLIYAFSPYQLLHLSQVQLISIGGLPLTLLYLERFWTTGRRHDGLMLALFMAAPDPLSVLLWLPGRAHRRSLRVDPPAAATQGAKSAPARAGAAVACAGGAVDPAVCAARSARARWTGAGTLAGRSRTVRRLAGGVLSFAL